jgi:hypothetical protein
MDFLVNTLTEAHSENKIKINFNSVSEIKKLMAYMYLLSSVDNILVLAVMKTFVLFVVI